MVTKETQELLVSFMYAADMVMLVFLKKKYIFIDVTGC